MLLPDKRTYTRSARDSLVAAVLVINDRIVAATEVGKAFRRVRFCMQVIL